jgi:hypothetical protein
MKHGTYINPNDAYPHLEGKTAILQDYSTFIMAQFDDMTLTEAFGWHSFAKEDFKVDEPKQGAIHG